MERTTMAQTDAVIERPMTLIEKLEKKATQYLQCKHNAKTLHDVRYFGGNANGLAEAINIVKQHGDWISVSEEIPVLEHECGFRSFEPTNFYQIIDNEGCLHNAYFSTNHYANDDRALFTLCELHFYNGKWIVFDEYEVITVDMAKYWMPLPQPPSEVQECF